MPQPTEFIFNKVFNSQYINELYDGDFVMIEETFADVLKEYDPFLQNIQSLFQARDVPGLKSAVHKIKPLCGYVGLTELQSQCQRFENDCQHREFASLAGECADLMNDLTNAKSIIVGEQARLSHFNKS